MAKEWGIQVLLLWDLWGKGEFGLSQEFADHALTPLGISWDRVHIDTIWVQKKSILKNQVLTKNKRSSVTNQNAY